MMVKKIELDLMKMSEDQEQKILKVIRKYAPFRSITWTENDGQG